MSVRFRSGIVSIFLACSLLPTLFAAEPTSPPASVKNSPQARDERIVPVQPGPSDGKIAFVTAKLLEGSHYSKQRFDDSVSSRFLDRYLESLDPQHMHFLQTDLADFEHYRSNLDNLTVNNGSREADTRPACEIFNRFVRLLEQRVAYADELLKNEKFAFDTDDRIPSNRHELPYPKDLAEAKKLWRERLRFEYLQERLGKIGAKKKTDTPALTFSAKDSATNSAPDKTARKASAKSKTEPEQIVETLTHRYHRNLRTFRDWNSDDVLQVYLNTLAHVYDPHSDYFGHAQLESFAISMNLALSGIGAELTTEDGYCTIRKLVPGYPADKSKKLKEKDRIIAVAQSNQPPVDVVEMNLNKVVQMIRGPKGTEVRLSVIPADGDAANSTVVTLIRDEIKLEDQAAKAKIIELPNGATEKLRLGVIDLPSFYARFDVGSPKRPPEVAKAAEPEDHGASTCADVARLIKKLKEENVGGIILDLRRNGGGSLDEAINLTGLFIKEGPVVQVRDFAKNVQEERDHDPSILYGGPLIVLTSRFSASASEIVAGALQDYGRALVVGDISTHGKGTVQSVNKLAPYMNDPSLTVDPGALKLTIKKFYRASGVSTQLKGVTPDIILPSVVNESKDVGEASLENPLPCDKIDSAKYEHLNMVEPYLAQLRARSEERIQHDQEFAYIREDIEQFKKNQADKTVSLNEQQRLKEQDEAEARQKARDKERLGRKEPQQKIYEITLKQVDLTGLPAPVQKTNAMAKLGKGKDAAVTLAKSGSAAARGKAEDADEEKPDPIDVPLVEAEHILVDYLSLLPRPDVAATGRAVE